jgi:hypothetical protein
MSFGLGYTLRNQGARRMVLGTIYAHARRMPEKAAVIYGDPSDRGNVYRNTLRVG